MYYTLSEVAEKLKVTWQTVRREIKRGNLKACKVGKVFRVSDVQLSEYLRKFEGR